VATPPGLTVEQLPSGPTASFDGSRPVSIGRDGAADVVVAHERTSRQHATLRFDAGVGWVFEDHSSGGTYVDGARVTRLVLSEPVVVTLGNPVEGASLRLVPVPSAPPETPEAPPAGATSPPLVANEAVPSAALPQLVVNEPVPSAAPPPTAPPMTPPVRGVPRGAASQVSIGQLSNVHEIAGRVRIGRAEDNDIVLPDLLVSHHHAELRVSPGGLYEIEDLQSHNGTFVDGRRIRRREALSEGSLVSIGHHLLCLTGGRLQEYVDTGEVSFAAIELSVLAGTRALLDQVSFPLAAGDFLAVLGPTGAGKTTLLRALTGNHPADRGSVLYNGRDVYAAYAELRNRIGYVPQDDILHPQLTVRSALGYAARLRFPPDVSAADRRHRVDEVMAELGLTERANLQVAKLSGGQRKRTSVAIELLTKPSLLFLDEPTSGLDPGYEKSVMELLRNLADGGRTVITVTHSIQSLDLCDRILFLAPGGQTAYFGPSGSALQFFGLGQYAEVFQHLDRAEPNSAKEAFAGSTDYLQYVRAPLEAEQDRPIRAAPPEAVTANSSWGHQLVSLVLRYLAVIAGDRRNSLLLFLQAPILGLLMLAVLGHGALDPGNPRARSTGGSVLVALILAATYLGASNSVREIVKERPILQRERATGLSASAYVLSKALVLGVLTVLQALLLVVIGVARQGGPAHGAVLSSGRLELFLVAALSGLAAMALGLVISALVSNADKALTILPVILFAQFLLTGALFNVRTTPGLEQLSYLTSAHWGYSAAASTADLDRLAGQGCNGSGPLVVAPSFCDPTHRHDASTWAEDMAALAGLTLVGLGGTWARVSPIGQPRRSRVK
jgi:ABC-type multidrug transport system ATPase subunit/pSer/pThr/pTyr-binding forkhead associated (FHA) protein